MLPKGLSEELRRKIRRIEISTRKLVQEELGGEYRTRFRGQGMQFDEHRVYTPGDDVRHIDWKASARTREPLIKKYEEERQLVVLLVIDVSGSQHFGTSHKLKSEICAELSAMLAFAALDAGDQVGVVFFAGDVEKIIPPQRGRNQMQRIVQEVLEFKARSKGTDLAKALRAADRAMRHPGIVFVLSDFRAEPAWMELKRLARRNDVVAVWLDDQGEAKLPSIGRLPLRNLETGGLAWIDAGSYPMQNWLAEASRKRVSALESGFKSSATEWIKISAQDDYGELLIRHLRTRGRRRGRR